MPENKPMPSPNYFPTIRNEILDLSGQGIKWKIEKTGNGKLSIHFTGPHNVIKRVRKIFPKNPH